MGSADGEKNLDADSRSLKVNSFESTPSPTVLSRLDDCEVMEDSIMERVLGNTIEVGKSEDSIRNPL
jgi:hypothetical protein